MSSNKKAKERLIELYGAECFVEKLHLRKDKNRIYKGKKQKEKMKQLTYHHILEKRNGGHATVENGALLSAENHAWFNKQSSQAQAQMNQIFQEYKRQADLGIAIVMPVKGIVEAQKVKFDLEDCVEIKLENNYDRAKEQRLIQEIRQEFVDR